MVKYKIISTGSQGNAVQVNNILFDCGVPYKAISGIDIDLVLLTHGHTDHINKATIKKLAYERPLLRFGAGIWLKDTLLDCGVRNIDTYEQGKIYDYRKFKVSPIKLYHDCPNFGYRLFLGAEKILYATDTGHLQGITAKDYDLYLIEANYTEAEIKERIKEKQDNGEYAYEYGVINTHLSREQADEFLKNNMGEHSKVEYLHKHKE